MTYDTEETDQGPQMVVPGAERAPPARPQALDGPATPTKPQKPCDHGLFDTQADMFG